MAKVTVSLAGVAYDRTRAIFDGSVGIAGCEVIAHPMTPEEAFTRALSHQEFDITELSMSNFMTLTARGENPYVAVPAFVSRMFRHSGIYIRTDKGIDRPEDMKDKIIGVPEYPMTAALWIRGIRQDEYGVAARDMSWRVGGQETPLTKPRIAIELPPSIDLQRIPGDATLNGMLDSGELDGMMSARAPSCLETNEKVVRLFPNYRADEETYFAKTGLFPIMHLVAIRRSIVYHADPMTLYAAPPPKLVFSKSAGLDDDDADPTLKPEDEEDHGEGPLPLPSLPLRWPRYIGGIGIGTSELV